MNTEKITIESTPVSSKDFFAGMREKERYYEKHYIQGFFRDTYHFLFWGIPRRIEDGIRAVRFAWQRVFRGYSDDAVWGLDSYLTDIVLPVLKQYRKDKRGIPFVDGFEDKPFEDQVVEWNRILDVMINSFQKMYDEDNGDGNWIIHNKEWHIENNRQIQEGLQYFGRYYRNLWD